VFAPRNKLVDHLFFRFRFDKHTAIALIPREAFYSQLVSLLFCRSAKKNSLNFSGNVDGTTSSHMVKKKPLHQASDAKAQS
jgi:hypothetical protein